jgi:serine phosphatase RsbU (regulator of sigma subunit)
MVIGLVAEWSTGTSQVDLCPGDILAVFSDGITEATNAAGEEFGEDRLLRALQAEGDGDLARALDAIFDEVTRWTAGTQNDDQTLVLARVR